MGGLPDMLFVIDTNKEEIAVPEASKLGIPVTAILDSNSIRDGITYPIPGNDDATRAIALYCDLIAGAVLDGISAEMVGGGRRHRRAGEGPVEELPEDGRPRAARPGAAPGNRPSHGFPEPTLRRTSDGRDHRALVKELREKTGAGMMDSKKALAENERRHGSGHRLAAYQGPRQGREEGAGRIAAEGLVGVAGEGSRRRGRGEFRDRFRCP